MVPMAPGMPSLESIGLPDLSILLKCQGNSLLILLNKRYVFFQLKVMTNFKTQNEQELFL